MNTSLMRFCALLMLVAVSIIGLPADAQVTTQCSDAERAHEFDFWIGEWEVSKDRGESWKTVFDGLYKKKS